MQWQRCGGLDSGGDRVGEDLRKVCTVGAKVRKQDGLAERAAAAIGNGALNGTSVYRSRDIGRQERAVEQP